MILRTPMHGPRRTGDAGAAVAVRLWKVANRLAANEVVVEAAGVNELDGLCRNAFIVDAIGAKQAFPSKDFRLGSSTTFMKSGRTRAW